MTTGKTKAAALCFAALAFAAAPALAVDKSEVEALIAKAEAARQQAAELEYEWRFTGKRIKEAKAALEAGDLETAREKAERALFEGERAIEQAGISAGTWEAAVPK